MCIFQKVTDTNIKQIENSMKARKVHLEMLHVISYNQRFQGKLNTFAPFKLCNICICNSFKNTLISYRPNNRNSPVFGAEYKF